MYEDEDPCSASQFESIFEIGRDVLVYPLLGSFSSSGRELRWPLRGLIERELNLIQSDMRRLHLVTIGNTIERVWRGQVTIEHDLRLIGSVSGDEIYRGGTVLKRVTKKKRSR
jgi:hypothetical protein